MDLGCGTSIPLREVCNREGDLGVGFGYSSGIFLSTTLMPCWSILLYPVFRSMWPIAAIMLIIGGILGAIGAAIGPETKGVSLRIARE
ncbi:hypothetical protein [Caldivirga maquilingensis]|uniref:hypothetical protein n=1 Tax=Caldivirga maquilingensis TaxID=76887 RepID=UPI0012EB04CC|nr:hypothetical protein [Caldivirga maquilingensis]